MKNSKHALVALLAVFAASTAMAQSMNMNSGYYGELGYSVMKSDDASLSAKPKLARLTIGNTINANLDVEGVFALTASKGSWKDATDSGEVSGKHFGIYAKPKMEIAKDTEVFARVGVSRTSWKSSSSAGDTNDSFTKLAYGLGVQTQFTKDVYGQVDYMNLGKKDGVSAKGFTVSVGTRF